MDMKECRKHLIEAYHKWLEEEDRRFILKDKEKEERSIRLMTYIIEDCLFFDTMKAEIDEAIK